MEKFGIIWKNIAEKCQKFFEWIERNKKTLLQLIPFLIALGVLICYIFQINSKVTFGVVNTLCVALIAVELVLGIVEKSNKAKLGIFLSCLSVSLVMLGLNLNNLFSEGSSLTLQDFIAELSLLSWLWIALIFVSVIGICFVLYSIKLKQMQESEQKQKHELEFKQETYEKQQSAKEGIDVSENGNDVVGSHNNGDKLRQGVIEENTLNIPKLLIKMLPIFIATIFTCAYLFEQRIAEENSISWNVATNSLVNVFCIVLVIIELVIGFWRTRNIEKIYMLLPAALLSGVLLYLNIPNNFNLFEGTSGLYKLFELPFVIWIWLINCFVASIACLLTLLEANIFSDEEIDDIKKIRNIVIIKNKKKKLNENEELLFSQNFSGFLAFLISFFIMAGLLIFAYCNGLRSSGDFFQIILQNDASKNVNYIIKIIIYYFLIVIAVTFTFYCIFCTVLDVLKNVLPRILGKKEDESFNFLIEYEFPVAVLLVTLSFLFFIGNKDWDVPNIAANWTGALNVILIIMVALVSIEVVRIILEQCAEKASLLKLIIYLIYISLMKLLNDILIGVITNFHIRIILNSIFSNIFPYKKGKIEQLIDRMLDVLLFNELCKLILKIDKKDFNNNQKRYVLWRHKR